MTANSVTEGQKLVIKRTFSAPVERVYNAWTDPAAVAQWLSPNVRWRQPLVQIENKVGGVRNITMRHSDGDTSIVEGRYLEIVPNERISFTWRWKSPGMGDEETKVTVEFRPAGVGTELTLTHEGITDKVMAEGATAGWGGCLDMLAQHLNEGYVLQAP